MKTLFLVVLVGLSIAACATVPTPTTAPDDAPGLPTRLPMYTGDYDVSLVTVERQARGAQTQRFSDVAENIFEDEFIKISWRDTSSELAFALNNKTDFSMRVLWDDASFVSPGGKTDRIIHGGVKIADRGASMPPTVIIRGGTLQDLVQPVSNIYWRRGSGKYDPSGWENTPLIGAAVEAYSESEVRSQLLSDASLKVLLPLEVNGTVTEYLFEFTTKGRVRPPRIER